MNWNIIISSNQAVRLFLVRGLFGELVDCFSNLEVHDPFVALMKEQFATVSTQEKSFWYRECAYHRRLRLRVDSESYDRRQGLYDDSTGLDDFQGMTKIRGATSMKASINTTQVFLAVRDALSSPDSVAYPIADLWGA